MVYLHSRYLVAALQLLQHATASRNCSPATSTKAFAPALLQNVDCCLFIGSVDWVLALRTSAHGALQVIPRLLSATARSSRKAIAQAYQEATPGQ
jgi:hypothetical protein